jgi:hypothetical protein
VVFGVAPETSFPKLLSRTPWDQWGDEGSGATPEPARGTRAFPLPASEFGLRARLKIPARGKLTWTTGAAANTFGTETT